MFNRVKFNFFFEKKEKIYIFIIIKILVGNQNSIGKSKFHWKIKISLENRNLIRKSKLHWKIEISLENRNFIGKSKFHEIFTKRYY